MDLYILGGLGRIVNSLDFDPASLNSLGRFTCGAYLLQNERRWQWICKVYTANFKGIFEGPKLEYVSQQATTMSLCYRMPQTAFCPRNLTQRVFRAKRPKSRGGDINSREMAKKRIWISNRLINYSRGWRRRWWWRVSNLVFYAQSTSAVIWERRWWRGW